MYFDSDNNEVKVGSRVKSSNDLPGGTVVEIQEIDCDYDDNLGRPVAYGPYVFVKWDDHDEPERFSGYAVNGYSPYQDEEYLFEDFDVVEADWEPDDEADWYDDDPDDAIEEGFMYGEDLT